MGVVTNTPVAFETLFMESLKGALQTRIEELWDEGIEQKLEEMKKAKHREIASLVLWMEKQMTIQTVGHELHITIKTENV